MSLELLLDPTTVAELMTAWPEKPATLPLPVDGKLTQLISAQTLFDFLDTGCVPTADINVIRNDAVRHPRLFTTADRLDAVKLRRWRDRGYTVQMRHLERWFPPMATLITSIQRQTGCTGYISAFVTPGGEQGLEYHWDQYLSIVVQLAGSKTWDLWEPKVFHPTRDHLTSVQAWQDRWVTQWKENGPDLSFDLTPGQVLILPRGWIHHPYSHDHAQPSVHLTFVLKERTPIWIAEQLTATAIDNPAFRRAIPPAELAPDTFTARVDQTRAMLIEHLSAIDPEELAHRLRSTADTEQDFDLVY
jgi:ribosomal protein L16 Arg81 hydroxylase